MQMIIQLNSREFYVNLCKKYSVLTFLRKLNSFEREFKRDYIQIFNNETEFCQLRIFTNFNESSFI